MNEKRDGAKQCEMRIMAFVQQQQQQESAKKAWIKILAWLYLLL